MPDRGVSRDRKRQVESGTTVGPAGDLDRAAERMNDPFRERESQPGAVSGARRVGSIERIEHERQVCVRDPLPGVLHDQPEGVRITAAFEADRPIGGRVTHGVHEQVLEHA
jgi:hypothetical protein